MPRRLRIAALGTVTEANFTEPTSSAFVDSVGRAWSRCLTDGFQVDGDAVAGPPAPLIIDMPPDPTDEAIRSALQRLSQTVTHRLIASQTGRLLMFHAGAVSHPETGASVVFVAPSGTGKTTLARLLGRTYGYLTDETAGIDPATGRIHPYPKPLSIASGDAGHKVESSPDDLGLLPAHPRPTVARVVLLHRDDSPAGPLIEELGMLQAVAALIPETSGLNRLPHPLKAVADLLDRTGPLLRLTYSEASDLVPLVSGLVEDAA